MKSKLISWFSSLSRAAKIGVITASVFVVGAAANGAGANNNAVKPPVGSGGSAAIQKIQTAPDVEHKTVTETKPVAFTSSTVDDASLSSGTTVTRVQGVAGVETITYDVTYTDGVETARTQTDDQVTTSPVNEVIAHGTYTAPAQVSCPNGTYVNSVGNTVCSPYSSPSAPAGATARCVDGTYSFSQSRSGTCSHHGGVSVWL